MDNSISLANPIRQDLFTAIRYETRSLHRGKAITGLQLPKRFVSKAAVLIAWQYTSAGILVVDPFAEHSTESLFNDPSAWAGYSVGDRRDFGRCVAYFAHVRMLPLHCVNPHEKNKRYQILCK